MIETKYYLLSLEQYEQYANCAKRLGVSVDYFLDEFVDIFGPDVVFVNGQWVEIED